MNHSWIGEIKRHGLPIVAQALGLSARGRAWGPCPACNATRRGSDDPRGPLGVSTSGGWQCHSCQAEGDAVDLIAYVKIGQRLRDCDSDDQVAVRLAAAKMGLCTQEDGRPPVRLQTVREAPVGVHARKINRFGGPPTEVVVEPTATPEQAGAGKPPPWSDDLCTAAEERLWNDDAAEPVRQYLMGGKGEGPGGTNGRRLPEDVIRKFRLGAIEWNGWWWVTIPLLDPETGADVNVKLRRVPNEAGESIKPKYTSCGGRPLTLFGQWSLTSDLGLPVIVVEGELDVIAMYAYGFEGSVVSGTAGAGAFRDEWLDVLEPYEQFVLAYDVEASNRGEEGAVALADRIGKYRCARAILPRKDASDCWSDGILAPDIAIAIDRAKPYDGMEVVRLGVMADIIEHDISNPSRLMGRPTGSDRLDELFAGWGNGVTVVTGGTKTGKTTFTTWAMREQALMGVPVLLTCFEQGASPLTQKLLRMQLRGDFLRRTEADRRRAMAELDRLPIHLLRHRGSVKLEEFVQTIRYHRRRNRVELIVLDHIGFMVDLSRRDMDETRQLQHSMRTLVQVANDEEVGVILIAHPTGGAEREGRRARLFDVKGTVSIQQDCAAGLALEWDPKVTVPGVRIHVDALRKEWGRGTGSDGWLWFEPESCLYADDQNDLPLIVTP